MFDAQVSSYLMMAAASTAPRRAVPAPSRAWGLRTCGSQLPKPVFSCVVLKRDAEPGRAREWVLPEVIENGKAGPSKERE
jgi:hypothetical protein